MESWHYSDKYAKRILKETAGCSVDYILRSALAKVFISVGVDSPEVFKQLLKYLKIEEEPSCQPS